MPIGAATHIIEDGSMRADHKYKDIDNDEINYSRMIKTQCEGASSALVAEVAVRVLLCGKPAMSETQPNKSNASATEQKQCFSISVSVGKWFKYTGSEDDK